MNNRIKVFLQCSAITACLSITSLCHADMNKVISLINEPSSAPTMNRTGFVGDFLFKLGHLT